MPKYQPKKENITTDNATKIVSRIVVIWASLLITKTISYI